MTNIRMIYHEQRSPQWFSWRRRKASASRAPVIMNDVPEWYPVKWWNELRLQDAGLEQPASAFTKRAWSHGREAEALAVRAAIEEYSIDPTIATCIELVDDPRFIASFDLLDKSLKVYCEIKSPYSQHTSKLWRALHDNVGRNVSPREYIPGYIWWQLVHFAGLLIDEPDLALGHAILCVYVDGDTISTMIPYTHLWEDWPPLKARWLLYLDGADQFQAERDLAAKDWAAAKDRHDVSTEEAGSGKGAPAGEIGGRGLQER